MVGNYCRQYRLKHRITLTSISSDMTHLKSLSAFEHNKSSNLKHIAVYAKLAKALGDIDNFSEGLIKELGDE